MPAGKHVAKGVGNALSVTSKYTVPSTGIWERIRRVLALDPHRSTGVPLNPQFRNPPPGANDPTEYTDPITTPAGDIADNPYWKRDVRRQYPRLSFVTQSQVAGLLTVGSKEKPKVELIGEKGTEQLSLVTKQGEEKGLAGLFGKDKGAVAGVLDENGLPPLPCGLNAGTVSARRYEINDDQGYPDQYPCRTFV